MLSTISWGQFILFLLLVAAIYYAYVALRFYRREFIGLVRGHQAATAAIGKPSAAAPSQPKQVAMFPEASPAGGEDTELFKVMEKVISLLKGVVSDGLTSGIGRDDLLDHLREILGGYRQLRKTPYQEAINNFIDRICSSNFSLQLSAEDLAGLWA